MILAEIARRNAFHVPHKPAFVMGGRTVTFAEYNERVNRLVHALHARGLGHGDRIAFLSRNSLECLDVYGAAEKGGFAVAPLNFRLSADELTGLLADIDPRVLFVQSSYCDVADTLTAAADGLDVVVLDGPAPAGWTTLDELLSASSADEPAVVVDPSDVCYLLSTSGTTGRPRAAMLTHQGQWLDALSLGSEMGLTPADRHLATMPLFHVGGRALVLAHTLRGCTVHLHEHFDAQAVANEITEARMTTTQVVPTMVAWLLADAPQADLSSLRLIFYAAAPMPTGLLRDAIERFGPIFAQGYGQTESGPLATLLRPEEHVLDGPGSERLASCGRAVPGVEVGVVGDDGAAVPTGGTGEVALRTPFAMIGYRGQPEQTAATLVDGRLHTGDMGRLDDEGYLFLVDRKRDMIISGGENVFPREIERVLESHPAVAEAAVIGVQDETWGETPVGVVVPLAGAELDERELVAYCRDRLATYKCPRTVELHDTLPRTPTGKVLKRALREVVGVPAAAGESGRSR